MLACIFDVECTALDGIGAGIVICTSIFDYITGEVTTYRLDTENFTPSDNFGIFEREEKVTLGHILAHLQQYDLLIGHNVDKFDIPFLKTRAMRLDVPCELHPFTYDTMKAWRRTGLLTPQNGFGKPQAGLAAVADALNIPQEKTKVMTGEWWFAIWGNKERKQLAMDSIVSHCEADVRMTAGVYRELLKMDTRASIKRLA